MIKYLAIRTNAEKTVQMPKDTYGICACVIDDDFMEIIRCVDHISKDIVWVKALADKLNQNDVDPIHLNDIIEDELYLLHELQE